MLTEITYDVKTPATLNLHDHGLVELELVDPTQFNLHQVGRYADFHIQPLLHIINNTLSGLLQEEAGVASASRSLPSADIPAP